MGVLNTTRRRGFRCLVSYCILALVLGVPGGVSAARAHPASRLRFAVYGDTRDGHDHMYYRTQRNGVAYVVTGGGGVPLYPCDPGKGAIPGDKWESVRNMVIGDVRGKQVTITAYRADGSVLDRFTLNAPVSQAGRSRSRTAAPPVRARQPAR